MSYTPDKGIQNKMTEMSRDSIFRKLLCFCEKLHCYITVLILTPGYFIFEITVVMPTLVEIYQMGIVKQTLHISTSTFCFINVVGNMMMSIMSDCKLKSGLQNIPQIKENENFCNVCKIYQTEKAWHCQACNVCIIRRDHHCYFFSRCIGLYNRRYYLMYITYILISMVYSSYYNYYFVSSKFEGHGFALTAFRILNPLLRYVIREKMTMNDFYVLLFLLNVALIPWSAYLLWFHMKNTLKGVTARDYRCPGERSWRENFLDVFGTKWYLAIVWPFADSPPIDETTTNDGDQSKDE